MFNEKEFNINYDSQKLLQETDRIAEIRSKLYSTICSPLTIEELYLVRSVLTEYSVISKMLATDLAAPDEEPTLWQKLSRK